MTNISGVRTTTGILAARRPVDMADKIALLDPNKAPFVTILKHVAKNKRVVYGPKFNWLEDDLYAIRTLVSGQTAADVTTLNVDDGTLFQAGNIIKIPATGECMLVTGVSTNALTVVRAYGSTSGAIVENDAEVIKIGIAMAENSSVPTAKSTQETDCYNYTQIFRTPINLSGTEAASKLYGGKDQAYQRSKAGIEHVRDIAYAMYFGQKKEDTSGATPRRTMGGIVEFLASASQTQAFASNATTLTYANFDTYVAQVAFSHGSQEKLLVAGPKLAAAINSWALSDLVVNDSQVEAEYGVRVKKLITSYGDMMVVYDPLLANSTTYAGYGFVLDMDGLAYAYLDGRDTKLYVNRQANDVDGVIDEYMTECSLELKNPKKHMLLTGCY